MTRTYSALWTAVLVLGLLIIAAGLRQALNYTPAAPDYRPPTTTCYPAHGVTPFKCEETPTP